MNLTTWLNEQARFVRDALAAGHLGEARNALRFIFEDWDAPDGIRPAMIIRLALSSMSRRDLKAARDAFTRGAEHLFADGDDLDAEIRADMYAALFRDRK
jgi:hypothetical protein